MSKILIAGASGFLGTHLCRALKLSGNELVALERHNEFLENTDRVARWDGKTIDSWVEELETADVLINLCGKNIVCKWSEENKRVLRESRVGVTQLLGEACALISVPPALWINMSAIGIYQPNLEEPLSEAGPWGNGFMGKLVQDWEGAFFGQDLLNVRRVALRAAPVLGPSDGAFEAFAKLVKWFVGGAAGSGKQWMSWIHVEDLVKMIEWVLRESGGTRGNRGNSKAIYNACAPEPVRNQEFMAELRLVYERPWAPPTPAVAIKLLGALGGPEPSLALNGYRVVPARAIAEGFDFRFPTLKEALRDLAAAR